MPFPQTQQGNRRSVGNLCYVLQDVRLTGTASAGERECVSRSACFGEDLAEESEHRRRKEGGGLYCVHICACVYTCVYKCITISFSSHKAYLVSRYEAA